MARFKCTALCGGSQVGGRQGSFSENYYRNASSTTDAFAQLNTLMDARLGIAGIRFRYYGARISDIDRPGSMRVFRVIPEKLGTLGASDTPWQTLVVAAFTAEGNKRQIKFKGIPDANIIDGSYSAGIAGGLQLNVLKALLVAQGWQILGTDLDNPRADVIAVNGDGSFAFDTDPGIAANTKIKFFRTFDANGKGVKGVFNAQAGITSGTGTITHWPVGRTISKGTVRVFTKSFKAIIEVKETDIISTKLGKDFFPFVGRRLIRR